VAHWNEERDRRSAQTMRECNVPGTEEVIGKFEKIGDPIYWNEFIHLLRAQSREEERIKRGLTQPLR
jgi:hypothetical protein